MATPTLAPVEVEDYPSRACGSSPGTTRRCRPAAAGTASAACTARCSAWSCGRPVRGCGFAIRSPAGSCSPLRRTARAGSAPNRTGNGNGRRGRKRKRAWRNSGPRCGGTAAGTPRKAAQTPHRLHSLRGRRTQRLRRRRVPGLAAALASRTTLKNVTLDSFIVSATPYEELRTRYDDGTWDRARFDERHILFREQSAPYAHVARILGSPGRYEST